MTDIDIAGLMEEPPGGENFGRAASSADPSTKERHVGLSVDDAQTREFVQDGGWGIVTTKDGSDAGIKAHRGVTHSAEYVDEELLLAAVERELGFTIDDVRSVYRQGRKSETQRELRGLIDARMLALSRSGANMLALARIFGWTIKAGDAAGGASCDTMERAIERARIAEYV